MRKILSVTVAAILVTLAALPVCAAPAVSFSVRAEIPDNQVDRSKSYFDLRLEPEQTQTLRVQIGNSGTEPLTATVALNPATTGENGMILYNEPSAAPGQQLSIADVARVTTPQLRVEAGGAATAEIEIAMPREPIEGAILGGLVFSAVTAGSEAPQNSAAGITLNNEVDYILAIKITRDDAQIQPDFALVGVEAGQSNHRTAVLATVENSRPAIVKGMNIHGEIYRNGSDEPLRELNLSGREAAPNSRFPLVFDWQNTRVEAGDYLLRLRVEHEGKEWVLDRDFSISGQQASSSNQGAVNIAASRIPVWSLVAIVLLAAALIWLIWDKLRRGKKAAE